MYDTACNVQPSKETAGQFLWAQFSIVMKSGKCNRFLYQICSKIAIIDHGRVLACGTTEELKKLLKTGETITIEAIALDEELLNGLKSLPHIFDVKYDNQVLKIRLSSAKHNLVRILNYLTEQGISFGRVFSELPTLNDVFLEITGKELRD